jgi:signal peptidase I
MKVPAPKEEISVETDASSSCEVRVETGVCGRRFGLSGCTADAPETVTLFYKGPSMNPLLTTTDVLHVRPYGGAKMRCGDVVVFPLPDGDSKVVHRVTSMHGGEIRTRGDNSRHPDGRVLKREQIIGRVDWIERGDARIRIYGGLAGRAQALASKARRLAGSCTRFLAMPVYNVLSKNRLLKRWFSNWTAARVIAIARPEGKEFQMLVGGCVIGRRPAGRDYWLIRRPFRLFVDEAALPPHTCQDTH